MTTDSINLRLMEAIHDSQLESVARELLQTCSETGTEAQISILQRAIGVCQRITQACEKEGKNVCGRLADAGIKARLRKETTEAQNRQFHLIRISLQTDDPSDAIEILKANGYVPKIETNGAAWEVYRRYSYNSQIICVSTDNSSARIILEWHRKPREKSLWRFFQPNGEDARLVPLPATLWPLTFGLRPIRILLEKSGIMKRRQPLGPFMGTATELIPELLEFASVNENDVLMDLGCGDGRIAIAAAMQRGCRTIGYEQDPDLCDIATKRAHSSGVSDLVQIHLDDAIHAPIRDATVIFLFLPVETVTELVPTLLNKMRPGARIIAHEQNRLECTPPPDESRALIADTIVTVAHAWNATAIPSKK